MTILTKLLTAYFWIAIAGLAVLLNRIAHFYQMTTSARSHHRAFFVPVVLFLAGMVRYVMIDRRVAGDVLGDLFFFFGGVCLSLIGYYLLKLMTGGR